LLFSIRHNRPGAPSIAVPSRWVGMYTLPQSALAVAVVLAVAVWD